MSQTEPRVSIGLPVYNGENFIKEALDSLLNQSYTDFELIISDNASTDATESICRSYAERDQRIRYHRQSENQGAAWNYNHVFALATGAYFKWAAHDDLCAPTFIERCVAILDQEPDVVLCTARTKSIDGSGNVLQEYHAKPLGNSPKAWQRFYEFTVVPHPCVSVFGLIRRDVLQRTKLIGKYSGSDRPLLGELSLYGRMYEIPEFLFFYRNHESQSWANKTLHEYQAWFDPSRLHKLTFPHWRLMVEHELSLWRAPLKIYERLRCHLVMARWIRKRWRFLMQNLVLQDAS